LISLSYLTNILGELIDFPIYFPIYAENNQQPLANGLPKSMRMASFRRRVQESLRKNTKFAVGKQTELDRTAKQQLHDQVVDPEGAVRRQKRKRFQFRVAHILSLIPLLLILGGYLSRDVVYKMMEKKVNENVEGISEQGKTGMVTDLHGLFVETVKGFQQDLTQVFERNAASFSDRAAEIIVDRISDDAKQQAETKKEPVIIVTRKENEQKEVTTVENNFISEREQLTRLRDRNLNGIFAGPQLRGVTVEIWNAGEVTAENISVAIVTPDNVTIELEGPSELSRNERATFAKHGLKEIVRRQGRLRVNMNCSNCRR